jgi:hypothetical protein
MFGPGNKPLIERLESRFAPQPTFVLPVYPAAESPRPSTVDQMLAPTPFPISVERALAAIAGSLLKAAADHDEAKTLYRDFDALSTRLKDYFQSRKDTHQAELRKKDELLTQDGRALVEKINGLQREASGIRGTCNAQEEIASQLRLTLQGVGPDPRRRDDWDDVFVAPAEVTQWEARIGDARGKLQAQESKVAASHNRLAAKQAEIAKTSGELARIKQERKAIRSELRGEFITGPHGLRTWKVDES